jgi:FkbM family methyltransferase
LPMTPPRLLSYAQNREDVLLARAFPRPDGFYIDVGAADPAELSVTKWLYDFGWSGVNVEPQGYYFDRLAAARPRDVNLRVAVTDSPGEVTFYEAPLHRGFSTTDATVAETMRQKGIDLVESRVPAVTLAELCDRHANRPIDFLKVDVEGCERAVLQSGDFQRHRPRVLVIEATEQNSTAPNHLAWEDLVFAADYQFATFDGLNRFYARAEDSNLVDLLRVPPNVFDDFGPADVWNRVAELERDNRRLTADIYHLQAELNVQRAAAAKAGGGWRRLFGRAA